MNNTWNVAKFGWMLIALPLVATAAASAHFQIVQSTPITVSAVVASANQDLASYRVHTVALNGKGGVTGRVQTMDSDSGTRGVGGMKVRFVQNGRTISQTTTEASGLFSADNVPVGVYSFVASGNNGFSAYSVRVVSSDSVKYDNFMEATAIAQPDAVRRLLDTAPETASSSAEFKSTMDEKGANRVALQNGTLNGKVFSAKDDSGAAANTEIFILRGGVSIANVMVNEKGEYKVPNMVPGTYGLVAVGPNGVAAIAFEAVDSEDQTNNNAETNVVFVSTTEPVLPAEETLNVYLTPSQDTVDTPAASPDPIVQDSFMPIEFAGQDAAFGGASGGTAGAAGDFSSFAATPASGGGAAGGLGGGGRLVTLGLIGGIIALGVTNGNGGDPGDASNPNP